MAQITGSSTIDWSGVTLEPIDFEQKFNDFSSRIDQVVMEIESGQFFFNSPATDTFISITLFSGGLLTFAGSGLLSDFPVINSFDYNNPFTGDVARFAGTLDFVGKEFFNSMTIGVLGLRVTIIGNIVEDSLGNTSGSITQLKVKDGSTQLTIKGNLVVDANFDISGTVTQISVLSGTNSILMSGLSLPYSALDSVTTANDLFAVVGNQLVGNDTITYTNNSNVGMTFFGGAGNDTITVSGPNADTLNGGDDNDILIGGLGQDTVNGGAGDDQITMLVTTGNEDTVDAGDDTDTLVLSGVVPGDHVVVVDLSSSTDQVVSIGGVSDALAQINVENLTASGLGSSVNVTGSDGDNIIIGSNGNDSIDGGAGNDTIIGGLAADTLQGGTDNDRFLLASTAEFAAGEIIDGGLGTDTLRYTGNAAATLTLTNLVSNIEQVEIANAAGLTTGLAAINVNAAALTSNGLTLVGNNGANQLTGTAFADTMTGNGGIDRLNGGAGDDTLDGGIGNDVIVIGTAADHGGGEVITGGAGTDVIFFSGTDGETLTLTDQVTAVEQVVIGTPPGWVAPAVITNLNVNAAAVGNSLSITGNAGANILTGTDFNDVLKGGGGDDVLTGGLGNNKLFGGGGHDSFFVNSPTDVVSEGLAAGTDTVFSTMNYTLGANLENLELTGVDSLNGTGNALKNIMTGNSGNNQLSGLAGNDQLIGGAGQDTVTGGTENDRIVMLVTAGDVDLANGGAGSDTLALVGAVDGDGVVVVDLSSLTDQVTRIGTVDPELLVQKNFEHLDASGLGSSVNATGSAGANLMIGSNDADQLTGNAGNDILNGGAGDDTLDGGISNDVFLIGDAADHGVGEVITGGAGTDVIRFTSVTGGEELTLSAGVTVESVVIANAAGVTTGTTALNVDASNVATALTITGNAGANTLTGTGLNDVVKGGGGDDTLRGGLGNDTVNGGSGNDTFLFGSGDGKDLVKDNSGSADKLLFDGGINPLDLVLSRQANDLRLAIHGSSDQITVQNWYTGSANRTETIQAGNGQTLLSTQVNQLIQAMAGFTQQTGLSWDAASGGAGDPGQQAQFQGIIAANWQ